MFRTIVVGVDGSLGAKRALDVAADLAKRDGARLVLAHVQEDIVAKGGGAIFANEDEIQAEIAKRTDELASQGIDTSLKQTTVYLGGPAPALMEFADEAQADLIVVGTRGQSALVGALLGSVAHRLLHLAHQPVLVVPNRAFANGDESRG